MIFNKKRRWFHLKTSKYRITYFTWVNHIRFIYVKEVIRYLKNVFCYAPYDAKFKELCQGCGIVVGMSENRRPPQTIADNRLYTRYSRLSKRNDNRFDNRLYCVNGALDRIESSP